MKHSFGYWLLRLIIVIVFVFSLGIFYTYWRLTKENPFTAPVNEITKNTTSVNNKQGPDNNKVNQNTVKISDYDIPTVYAIGKILRYQFVQNPQTNENTLYVRFLTGEKVLAVRVGYVSTGGKGLYNFIVQDLIQGQKEEVGKILHDGQAGLPMVENNYIILSSINNNVQEKLCQDSLGLNLDQKWCKFDPSSKSYTTEELVKQMETNLLTNDQNLINAMKFSEYFSLDGNISINLQINYSVPDTIKIP